jgi:hypothetical protein
MVNFLHKKIELKNILRFQIHEFEYYLQSLRFYLNFQSLDYGVNIFARERTKTTKKINVAATTRSACFSDFKKEK